MKLQTQIPLTKQPDNLMGYTSNIVLLGSCFVENIGEKLNYFKFQNFQNPFGVLFHPQAIETLVFKAVKGEVYSESDVFFHNEQWHCFDAHSKLSNVSKESLLEHLNINLKTTNNALKNASHIVVTLGTAWIYRLKKSGKPVANCHKMPQTEFDKTLLSVLDIEQSLQNLIGNIKAINPKAIVIFTVSPIRHIKDGFVENSQSKAHLITAVHRVLNSEKNTFYFPSYEIMMDELRDYRFYAEDMLHPNATAIQYIWEAFKTVWVSLTAFKIMDEVDVVQKGLRHKAFNPGSALHLKFLQNLDKKKEILRLQFPHIEF
ncbi:MAG: GSCFA domain-containing protein [Flavobacteriaceae bacterium]